MTKRTALEAARDDLAAEEALIERLREQEAKRVEAWKTASAAVDATRRAIAEATDRAKGLARAIEAMDPNPKGENDADA